MRTIIEPFRMKMVEPIRMTTREEREQRIREAGYNAFALRTDGVLIDLLTDSGTGTMSSEQWAGMIRGDEGYAGARSFYRFQDVVRELTGLKHVIPTHQGRAAERILFSVAVRPGDVVPNNTHFDTTRANIEFQGAEAVDLVPELPTDTIAPFKGDMDIARLAHLLAHTPRARIPMVMITLTNNAAGGQPVSMANIRAVRELCDHYGLPLFIDACRFAENAWFIKEREEGYAHVPLRTIAREIFGYADGVTMSAKKDAIVNIGGFLALNDDRLADKARTMLILTEGFPTYGGLAGRDLEAMAQGLDEVLDESYMRYRIASTAYLGDSLEAAGVPILKPTGGHAIYVDAARLLPHIPREHLPGKALEVELYVEGGIRACEIGTVMFGRTDPDTGRQIPARQELVRLAIPRRVYTQSHIDYVAEVFGELVERAPMFCGYAFETEAPVLRHFTSTFRPLV